MLFSVDSAQSDIAKLKEQIKQIEEFVELAGNYPEDTDEQKAIKYYAYSGKSVDVANRLNDEGIKIGKRKWIQKDVTELIDKPSDDPLLKILRDNYKRRRKGVNRIYN